MFRNFLCNLGSKLAPSRAHGAESLVERRGLRSQMLAPELNHSRLLASHRGVL